jgi:steroid 5-alpha reductase family enzyme
MNFDTVTVYFNAIASVFGASIEASVVKTLYLLAFFIIFSYVAQKSTAWWSWVDRLWSITPVVYVVVIADDVRSPRLWVMAVLSYLWGARLTANFARKGGYGHEEDYRWEVCRDFCRKNDPFHPLAQELFHAFFVCVYQHILLWLIAAPAAAVAATSSAPLGFCDAAATFAFLLALVAETVTDEQQWAFQRAKYALTPAQRQAAGGDFARGFLTTGVFSVSRHLNFFAEQSVWWAFSALAIASGATQASQTLLVAVLTGPVLLSSLFQGSTWLTESLSIAKYPAYLEYQKTTSRLMPWWPGKPLKG